MPSRIIKEGIHTSDKVNAMTDFQFRLWVSLITFVDDYGRGDARPAVIKGVCFPLREKVTVKDIERGMNTLVEIGCIRLYQVEGRMYLYFPHWESHQKIRNKRSKYPAPDNLSTPVDNLSTIVDNSSTIVPVIQSNPIQSESISKDIKNRYGEYKNVLLTDEEVEKLRNRYPDYEDRIEKLSEYIASKGKKYSSHYATINSWARKDKPVKQVETHVSGTDEIKRLLEGM